MDRKDTDFTGKTVVVAGGSGAIGNAIAHAFRERGATVWAWGTRACTEDYDGEAHTDMSGLNYARVDLSSRRQIADTIAALPALDVLVVAHGINLTGGAEFEDEGFDRVLSVNLSSAFKCAMAARAALGSSRGSIIFVTSRAALRPSKNFPAYSAAKSGLENLTRLLGMEWAREGIRVNAVAPGFIPSRMTDGPVRQRD